MTLPCAAQAQLGVPTKNAPQASANLPVTFLADRVSYDKTNSIVSATGHVQAWQNGHYLSADRVTFPGHEERRHHRHARAFGQWRQDGGQRRQAHRRQAE
jgi:lipopolysaccharide assembly outer membrane protein LptD (OstA)